MSIHVKHFVYCLILYSVTLINVTVILNFKDQKEEKNSVSNTKNV